MIIFEDVENGRERLFADARSLPIHLDERGPGIEGALAVHVYPSAAMPLPPGSPGRIERPPHGRECVLVDQPTDQRVRRARIADTGGAIDWGEFGESGGGAGRER